MPFLTIGPRGQKLETQQTTHEGRVRGLKKSREQIRKPLYSVGSEYAIKAMLKLGGLAEERDTEKGEMYRVFGNKESAPTGSFNDPF